MVKFRGSDFFLKLSFRVLLSQINIFGLMLNLELEVTLDSGARTISSLASVDIFLFYNFYVSHLINFDLQIKLCWHPGCFVSSKKNGTNRTSSSFIEVMMKGTTTTINDLLNQMQ